VRIDSRFMGPPGSANGGVTAGLLSLETGTSEVTLRRPPPLDTDLRVDGHDLYAGDVLVATGAAATVDVEVPEPPSLAEARAAGERYAGLTVHPFPGCFVCGVDRSPPDALGLRPGPVGEGRAAAVWTPLDDSPVMVWAALDCPGGWAADMPGRPMVLGRMALRLDALPAAGVEHVVQGWVVDVDGRKVRTGTALHAPDGSALAVALSTWIAVDVEKVGRPAT
jgi:hypothetical protein